jgi:hypothetical protein
MHKHSPSWFALSSAVTAHIRYDALVPAAIFTGLASCVVVLRWYSRAVCKPGNVNMEDYFISIAMVCCSVRIGNKSAKPSSYFRSVLQA